MTNALDQYTGLAAATGCPVNPAEKLIYDLDGNLTGTGLVQSDFDNDGDVDLIDFAHYRDCFNGPNNPPATTGCGDADLDADGDVDLEDFAAFRNCFNGSNQPAVCAATTRPMRYTWDGENRLTGVESLAPTDGTYKKLDFAYDYMGRRVQKKVSHWGGLSTGWVLDTDERFVYDGWNVVMVLDGNDENATLRKYTWGLDLSGQTGTPYAQGIHNAGGIGGLLAAEEPQTTGDPKRYWFFYDMQGNVGQVLNYVSGETPTIHRVAHYEYDPYGNAITTNNDVCATDGTVITSDAGYANDNPLRFSTKWLDGEASLYYYGYRYYSPRLGRWISRDPIGTLGGLNLVAFVRNQPVGRYDVLGRRECQYNGAGKAEWESVEVRVLTEHDIELPLPEWGELVVAVAGEFCDIGKIKAYTTPISFLSPDDLRMGCRCEWQSKQKCQYKCREDPSYASRIWAWLAGGTPDRPPQTYNDVIARCGPRVFTFGITTPRLGTTPGVTCNCPNPAEATKGKGAMQPSECCKQCCGGT